jgi:hypothetical protein
MIPSTSLKKAEPLPSKILVDVLSMIFSIFLMTKCCLSATPVKIYLFWLFLPIMFIKIAPELLFIEVTLHILLSQSKSSSSLN